MSVVVINSWRHIQYFLISLHEPGLLISRKNPISKPVAGKRAENFVDRKVSLNKKHLGTNFVLYFVF